MGLTAMVVGSVSGFGMQMMNNALQKVPLSRSELRLTCLISSLFYGLYALMSGIRFTKPVIGWCIDVGYNTDWNWRILYHYVFLLLIIVAFWLR